MKGQNIYISLFVIFLFNSCYQESSTHTGWDYNNPKNGGFQKVPYLEQETGPGLILIEGGTFNTALKQDSFAADSKKEIVVASFYLDEFEVSNEAWCEYLYWTDRVFGIDFPMVYDNALPDTLIWQNHIGNHEDYTQNYLRHPSYRNYPVVGISWIQANRYCEWRTDRVNEFILIREGVLMHNPDQINEPFTTPAYYANQYENGANPTGQLPDLDPSKVGGYGRRNLGTRIVRMEDGILLPRYRLPTESEWEYAASGSVIIDKKTKKKLDESKVKLGQLIQPKYYEKNLFNSYLPMPADSFIPNEFGIYGMSGNVSEWVIDSYMQRDSFNIEEVAPVNGKTLSINRKNTYSNVQQKYEEVIYDIAKFRSLSSKVKSKAYLIEKSDSIGLEFFGLLEQHIEYAIQLESKRAFQDASRVIRQIYDELITDCNNKYEQQSANQGIQTYAPSYLLELKGAIAQCIIDLPGNIPSQVMSPSDYNTIKCLSGYRSLIDTTMSGFFSEEKVYKGANWRDTKKWIDPNFRRHLNQYESSCLVGFRCAMDRVGSPVGLSGKKRK